MTTSLNKPMEQPLTGEGYILRGLTADGFEVFYTGKAGDGDSSWVSPSRVDAFRYGLGLARRTATRFNTMTQVHGI